MSYSLDLRQRVINFIAEGGSKAQACRVFKVARKTIYNWIEKNETLGTLEDPPPLRKWKKIDPEVLRELVQKQPDAAASTYAQHFGVCPQSIHKALKRLKITQKKRRPSIKNELKKKEAIS